jgi:hypothetical protein
MLSRNSTKLFTIGLKVASSLSPGLCIKGGVRGLSPIPIVDTLCLFKHSPICMNETRYGMDDRRIEKLARLTGVGSSRGYQCDGLDSTLKCGRIGEMVLLVCGDFMVVKVLMGAL